MHGLIPWKTPRGFSVRDLVDAALNYPPYFAHEIIEKWDDQYFRQLEPFVLERRWDSNTTIDAARIVGTRRLDYYEKITWLDFLQMGKRMKLNLQLYINNPAYYFLAKPKEPLMHYLRIDGGGFYVGQDGDHRSGIAKFALHYLSHAELHGVAVSNYTVDWEAKRLFDEASKLLIINGIRIEPQIIEPVRHDGPGWMEERHQLEFKALNPKKSNCIILSKQDLRELISKLQNINWVDRNFKRRIMGKFKEIL